MALEQSPEEWQKLSMSTTGKSVSGRGTSRCRASPVGQWLRIHLPRQETRVRSLDRDDPA